MIFGIERDRMRHWQIVSVSTRMAQRFAIRHVYYPASGQRRHTHEMQFGFVIRMVHRLHRMWFNRVKDMVRNHLWLPGAHDATHGTRLITLRRVMNCRPTAVFFRYGNAGKIRPCKQHKICPFCWGRLAAFMYRRLKTRIRAAHKKHDDLVLSCRVAAHYVPAKNFTSASGLSLEEVYAHAKVLHKELAKHKKRYRALTKELQRKTLGSAWRVVVNPQDSGWTIEVRQLVLVQAGKRRIPWAQFRGGKTMFLASVKADDQDAMYSLIGRFLEYPAGLLTSYAELTAVYLQAGYSLRTVSGTGVFRTCGDGLLRAFKKDKKHGEATSTTHADQNSGDECNPATDAVFV